MPRKHTVRNFQPDSYYHIYNVGANDYPIFHDDEDFKTFQGFLEDYLSPPPNKDDLKVTVEFKGKKLTGVPRQPNNYNDLVSLVAYTLTPMEFHLIIFQKPSELIAKFMQSLNTRYSMYFNKRHNRTGSPFQGKYKSMRLENEADLMLLSKYVHKKSWRDDGKARSSYPVYLQQESVAWIDSDHLFDFFVNDSTDEQHTPSNLIKQLTDGSFFNLADELGELRLDY